MRFPVAQEVLILCALTVEETEQVKSLCEQSPPGKALEPWSSELASDHPVALAFAQETGQRSADEMVPREPESAVHPLGLQTHCLHSSGPVSASVK